MTKPTISTRQVLLVWSNLVFLLLCSIRVQGFVTQQSHFQSTTSLHAVQNGLTSLPKGLSPFEKSLSKSLDLQGTFRTLAANALDRALQDNLLKCEIEFPPLAGGDQSKSQFDDYDNISELNANRDFCVQLAPLLQTKFRPNKDIWFILPDDKECELAKTEWKGQRYQSACRFTSIRAALTAVLDSSTSSSGSGNDNNQKGQMALAWGSTLASTLDKLQGGDGILADSSTLDDLSVNDNDSPPENRLHLVCQPGNGGPVEDWINTKQLHVSAGGTVPTCIVNGALDKVRDGYYPGIFFPALAATTSFYQEFQAVFFLKPLVDKGLYGWVYRVYPEPWQVILQTATTVERGGQSEVKVEDTVALVSETRPSYQQAVQALIRAAS